MEGIIQALQAIAKAIEKSVSSESSHIVGTAGEPAFQNSWVHYASSFKNVGFFRDPNGIVHLQGLAKSGTIGNPIFTLPAGYRPAESLVYAVNAAGAWATVYVYTNGNVTLVTAPAGNSFCSLDGITFRAEV